MSEPMSDDDLARARDRVACGDLIGSALAWGSLAPKMLAEIDRLLADNAALRKQVECHAAHIARASEVIAARAERDALARLEAWEKAEEWQSRWYTLEPDGIRLTAYRPAGCEVVAYARPGDVPGNMRGRYVVVAGTDEKPVAISEVILAALQRWQELYGGYEQKGGA